MRRRPYESREHAQRIGETLGVKIDIVLNPVDLSPQKFIDAVGLAEKVGFDGIWTYDHLSGAVLGGGSSLDVWSALTMIAMSTTRVEFGPLVINATTRLAAHIATASTTLANLSKGRFLLGLGAGAGPESPYSHELTMLGVTTSSAAQRRQQIADTVDYLKALWRGDTAYESPTATFREPVGLANPCRVPTIIVGANGPRMAAVAGRTADGVNVHSWERDLEGLVEIARGSAPSPDQFGVTVEMPLDLDSVRPNSECRQRLDRLRVSRAMFAWHSEMGTAVISESRPHG